MNRAERRRRGMRRGASLTVRLAGIGALIGAGLASGYVGTYRSSRAQAAFAGTSCAGDLGVPINDDTTLRAAIARVNAGTCDMIDISASITIGSDLPAIDVASLTASAASLIQLTALTDDSVISGDDSYGGFAFLGSATHDLVLSVSDVTLADFSADDTSVVDVDVIYAGTFSVRIDGSTFDGNYIGSSDGGAIYNAAGVLTIRDSTFVDNYAANGDGGAIDAPSGAKIYDSVFRGNHGVRNGGAISVGGDLHVYGSTFDGNFVPAGDGGAIYASAFTRMWIYDSTFDSNGVITGRGGAIYAGDDVHLYRSTFDTNRVRVSGDGGAVYAGGDAEVHDSTFDTNSVGIGDGGAVRVNGDDFEVRDSTFSNNTVNLGDGGAVAASAHAVVENSRFAGNYASTYGGAVLAATAEVWQSEFDSNAASRGGGLYVGYGASVVRSVFSSNYADFGGAIYGYRVNDAVISLRRSSFIDNYAGRLGGAVAAGGLYGSEVSFIGNGDDSVGHVTTYYGGAAAVDDTISLTNSTLYRNAVTKYGGALYASKFSAAPITLSFVTAVDNLAADGLTLSSGGSGPFSLNGSVLVSDDSTATLCWDNQSSVALDADDAPYSYASTTDHACGAWDVSMGSLGFNSPISGVPLPGEEVTPGRQVLLPDDTSILVNALPSIYLGDALSPFYGLDRDQLGQDRLSPYWRTTVGAVQVLPEPIITSEPQDLSVAVTASASFAVTATGGSGRLGYQWQASSDGGATWANIASNPTAGDTTLVFAATTAYDDGLFLRAVVTDENLVATNSVPAELTVVSPTPPPPPVPPTPPTPPTPSSPPSAPREAIAIASTRAAAVAWIRPESLGTSGLIEYEVMDESGDMGCVLPGSTTGTLNCSVVGLAPGQSYRFKVRASNDAGWGPWSDWTSAVTPEAEPVTATVTIAGSRSGSKVHVVGITAGLAGATVQSMVKLKGQTTYRAGGLRVVDGAGSFTWKRKTGKKIYVYFVSGSVRSNRVIIPAK